MIGIKIKGEEMYFYSVEMKEEYLQCLSRGPPSIDLDVKKYPPKRGLRISNPKNRKEILTCLWIMREYALELQDKEDE
jgi:hypothetical protein